MTSARRHTGHGRPGWPRPRRSGAPGLARACALDARGPREPEEGGAALQWSPEGRLRRARAEGRAGSRRGGATRRTRASGGYHDAQKLTAELLAKTAWPEELGSGGGGRRNPSRLRRRRGRWRRLGASPVDSLQGEDEGSEAELVAVLAGRGEAPNGGDGEL
jgi:hypothetical protein